MPYVIWFCPQKTFMWY